MADRVINFSLGRITDGGADQDAGVLGDPVFGEIENIAGGDVEYGVNESQSGDSTDRYWNGMFSLTDFTFDLLKASERPESLGPGELYLDLYVSWYEGRTLKTQRERLVGFLMNPGSRTLSRPTDSPRSLTFVPYIHAWGGNEDLQGVGEEEASLYVKTRKPVVLRRRENGVGTSIDEYEAIKTAHGV